MGPVLHSSSLHTGRAQLYGDPILRYPIRYLILAGALIGGGLARGVPASTDASVTADPDTPSASRVEVKGIRSPARWSYRAFQEGLDTFEDKHSLAPHGVLTFVLRPTTPLPEHATVAIDSETCR